MKKKLFWIAVIIALGVYGWVDARQRARMDRGLKRHRTDLTVYTVASQAIAAGENPYDARSPRGYAYVYPPTLAILLMPVADWDPADAAVLVFALSMAALALTLRWLADVSVGTRLGGPAVAVATFVCVGFLHQSFQRCQITPTLLFLQVGALACLGQRRFFLAGLLLAIGGSLRLTPFLVAACVALGLLASDRNSAFRFIGGGVVAVALCFAVLPCAALGPTRAKTMLVQWARMNEELFGVHPGEMPVLVRIKEYRFKNQATRRVLATWTGWFTGAQFHDERPDLVPNTARAVDVAALVFGCAMGALALVLGFRHLRSPTAPAFAVVFAIVMLMPVLMTRYVWPTHYTAALPLVAIAWTKVQGRRVAETGAVVFLIATVGFYAAHAPPLEVLGAAGPLLAGGALLMLSFVTRRAERGLSLSESRAPR